MGWTPLKSHSFVFGSMSLANAHNCETTNVINITEFCHLKKFSCASSVIAPPPLVPCNHWCVQAWVFIHFSKYLGVELLGHVIAYVYSSSGNCHTVLQSGCAILHFHQLCQSSSCSTSLSALGIVSCCFSSGFLTGMQRCHDAVNCYMWNVEQGEERKRTHSDSYIGRNFVIIKPMTTIQKESHW